MSRMKTVSRFAAGAATVALFGLVGMSPAGAAAPYQLYTVLDSDGTTSLGTINQDTLAFAALGGPVSPGISFDGIDIFGETGYGVVNSGGSDWVLTWDHNTGVATAPVAITQTIEELPIDGVFGADTLADGTLIAFMDFDGDQNTLTYVVSIDPATGVATELVDVTGASQYFDSLATDPTTGITYAFVDEDDGIAEYLELDLIGNSYTGPTALTTISDSFGDGHMYGADFDSNGVLWFYYVVFGGGEEDGYTLLAATSGAFSAIVGADFAGGGEVSGDLRAANLTVGPPVKLALAATGLPITGIAAGGVALLGAGLAGFFLARRRAIA